MAAVSIHNNNSIEPQYGSPNLNVDSNGNVAVYSSFVDNVGNPELNWFDYCTSSASFYTPVEAFSPLPDETYHLTYPTEEADIRFNYDTSEYLHYGQDRLAKFANLVDIHMNMVTPDFAEAGRCFEREHFATVAKTHSIKDEGSGTHLKAGSVTFNPIDELLKHESPPLSTKRLENVEKSYIDSIEATEVSVDLITNRRPFRCGQEGCNKTFKNPQTMKMHHKTHYTDGSAVFKDGVPTLPTLISSTFKAGPNKKIPSQCPKCRKTFVGLYELRRHYGRKHSEGEKPFRCSKCEKRFYVEVDVRDHEKLCGEPIECKCGLKFAFKCNMVAHKKSHPACQNRPIYNSNSSSIENLCHHSRSSKLTPPYRRGTKRQRVEETSSDSSCTTSQPPPNYTPPAPDFRFQPESSFTPHIGDHCDIAGLDSTSDGVLVGIQHTLLEAKIFKSAHQGAFPHELFSTGRSVASCKAVSPS